jgi:hypothetical protein
MKAKTDTFMYNVDGVKLFKEGEEVPKGYVDTPEKVKKPAPAKKVAQNVNK